MTPTSNNRPFLLDISRMIWRRWSGRLPTGIDRVCLAYLEQYRARSQAVIQRRGFRRILSERVSDKLFEQLLNPGRSFRGDVMRTLGRAGASGFSELPGNGRLYLNVGHTGLEEQSFADWTKAAGVRSVYFLHDLIPITHPEYCRAGEAPRHERRMRHMLETATGIVANSQATLDSLSEFASGEGLAEPPTVAALLGTEIGETKREAANAKPDRPTFVMLGTIEARKNHLLMLQVWARMARALGDKAPRLLVIGQRGWECEQVFDLLDRSEVLRGAVTEIGRADDHELEAHLASARALLFPSLIEGYGLPLVEALGAGTPVIASDLPVFEEIGEGVPELIDPLDGPAWERAILDYAAEGSERRAAQLQRLAGYQAPTWADHFSKVNSWLAEL